MHWTPKKNRWVAGLSLTLFLWFGTSFIGIPGFTGRWQLSQGIWLVFAVAFMLALLFSFVAYTRNRPHGDWVLLTVLPLWFWMQYVDHLRFFLFGTTAEHAKQYYAVHRNLYLVPPLENRIVPDAFHLVMDALVVLIWFWVTFRILKKTLVRPKQGP